MKRIAWRLGATVVVVLLLGSVVVACSVALAQSPTPVLPTGVSNEFIAFIGMGVLQTATIGIGLANRFSSNTKDSIAAIAADIGKMRACLGDIKSNAHVLAESLTEQTNNGRQHWHRMAMECSIQHSKPLPDEPKLMSKPKLQ